MIYSNRIAYRVDVTVEIMEELAADPLFVAIKESCDDIRRSTEMINRFGDRFDLFTGVDNLAFEALSVGAVGWVAGLVCAFPRETVAIYRLMQAGPPRRRRSPSTAGSGRCSTSTSRPISSRTSSSPRCMRSAPTTACACRASRCRANAARRWRRWSRTRWRRGRCCRSSEVAVDKQPDDHRHVHESATTDAIARHRRRSAPASSASRPPPISPRPGVPSRSSTAPASARRRVRAMPPHFAFTDVLPLAHKGMMRQLPKWLADPLGPLSIPPAYLPKLLPWLSRFWRAGGRRQLRGEPRRAGRADEARRSRMDGADAALRHAGHAARGRLAGTLRKRGRIPGVAARLGGARPLRHRIPASGEDPNSPTISPASAPRFMRGTFVPGWKTVSDPEGSRQGDLATTRKRQGAVFVRGDVGARHAVAADGSPCSSATGAPSWRGSW